MVFAQCVSCNYVVIASTMHATAGAGGFSPDDVECIRQLPCGIVRGPELLRAPGKVGNRPTQWQGALHVVCSAAILHQP
jgi:hypothetical protein